MLKRSKGKVQPALNGVGGIPIKKIEKKGKK